MIAINNQQIVGIDCSNKVFTIGEIFSTGMINSLIWFMKDSTKQIAQVR